MTTPLQALAQMNASIETQRASMEFARLALFVMGHGGFSKAAIAAGRSSREGLLGPKLASIVKSGVGGISRENLLQQKAAQTAITLSGSAFEDFSAISRGFLDSLVNSAFDVLRAAAVPLPMRQAQVGSVSVAAQVFAVSESTVKSITRLSFTGQHAGPQKAAGGIVIGQELARFGVSGTVQYIQRLLQNAVTILTDQTFFSAILAGITQNTSTGLTAESVRADLAAMLRQISTGQDSRLFLVATPSISKNWSMLTDSKGLSAFPDLSPVGGQIQGIICLPSDGLSVGQVCLLDASGLGCAQGDIALVDISESTLNFADTPNSPPTPGTTMVSLWQNNQTGIAVERFFLGAKLRGDAVALCVNSGSYASGNSPP